MAEEKKTTEHIAVQPEIISWVDFLQERPPGSIVQVLGASGKFEKTYSSEKYLGLILLRQIGLLFKGL